MSSFFQKSLITLHYLVKVNLACDLPWSMHRYDSNAAVNYLHPVEGHDVGDGSAATKVNLSKLRRLEADNMLIHDSAKLSEILRVCVVGA